MNTGTLKLYSIRPEQEDYLWDQGIFGTGNAESMLNTVFWYDCKCFGLSGGDEHRNLEVVQYSIDHDEKGRYLHFVGRLSKNYQGGLQHRRIQNKDLRIYSTPERSDRCIVVLRISISCSQKRSILQETY